MPDKIKPVQAIILETLVNTLLFVLKHNYNDIIAEAGYLKLFLLLYYNIVRSRSLARQQANTTCKQSLFLYKSFEAKYWIRRTTCLDILLSYPAVFVSSNISSNKNFS